MGSIEMNSKQRYGNIDNTVKIRDTRNIKLKYFLTFLSIAQCGIGFLMAKEMYVVMIILLSALMLMQKSAFKAIHVLPWVVANVFVYILQTISYEAFDVSIVQLAYFFIRLMVPALYYVLIGEEYYKYYIKVIFAYTVMSFIFFGIEVFAPFIGTYLRTLAIEFSSVTGSLVVEYKNISLFLLYTFTIQSRFHAIPRNSGPFWEPGAFAVYLTVALVLLFLSNRSVRNKYAYVFSLALLTTQSSAGYPALFAYYFFTMMFSKSSLKLPYLFLIGFIYSAAPLVVFTAATIVFFIGFRQFSFNPKYIRFNSLKSVMGIGLFEFIDQIGVVILMSATNIIIAQITSPAEVVPYHVIMRVFGLFLTVYTLSINPLLPTFTEAHTKNDIQWIKKVLRKTNIIFILCAMGMLLSIPLSKSLFDFLVRGKADVSNVLVLIVVAITLMRMFGAVYSKLLTGCGKVRLLALSSFISALIYITFILSFGKRLNLGVEGVLLAQIAVGIFTLSIAYKQSVKVINGTARGVWAK